MAKLTKSETKILERVKYINEHGGLAGLAVAPNEPLYLLKKHRFIRRLAEKGLIEWVPWTKEKGAGWRIKSDG